MDILAIFRHTHLSQELLLISHYVRITYPLLSAFYPTLHQLDPWIRLRDHLIHCYIYIYTYIYIYIIHTSHIMLQHKYPYVCKIVTIYIDIYNMHIYIQYNICTHIYIYTYIYIYPYVFIIYSIISHEISRSPDDLRGLLDLRSLFRWHLGWEKEMICWNFHGLFKWFNGISKDI